MRIINRVLAVAAALGLVAGGLLVAVEIALAGLGQGPWVIPYDDWYRSARANRWESSGARSLFVSLAVAGLILLVLQMVRTRPRSVPLGDGRARAGLSRRSLEKALARTAVSLAGVATAKAMVRRDRARVIAGSLGPPDELGTRVEQAAKARLHDLGLDDRLDVAVRVHSHKT